MKTKNYLCAILTVAGSAFASQPMLASASDLNLPGVMMQQQAVRGVVTDAHGEPIVGATIVVVGKTTGAITDTNGRFTLSVDAGTQLKISYVGYKTVTLRAKDNMQVALEEDAGQLSEVVVVGYGTQKKANLTGAVSTVDLSKTMAGRPQQDVTKALQGAVPGLTITSSNGSINGQASMRIRGVGTLSNKAVSNPLIVVDGVPMDDISFLNTQDIESISVLKDAASTSIYGTRAAFGVILIQTKGAHPAERTTVTYNNNFSWDQATYLPDYPDVPTQLKMALEGKANAGQYEVELFGMYFDKLLPYAEKWKAQNGGKIGYGEMRKYVSDDNVGDYAMIGATPYYYADWDIKKIFFNNAAPSQSHILSVQGSSGKTNYYLSFGYDEKQGLMKIHPDKLNKYNASANITSNVTDWLQIGARINFTRKMYKRPDTWSSTYQYLWRWGSFFIPSGTIDGLDQRVIAMQKQASDRPVKK